MEHFLLLAATLSGITLLSVAINQPQETKHEKEILLTAQTGSQKS